jgi:hypothetical protein
LLNVEDDREDDEGGVNGRYPPPTGDCVVPRCDDIFPEYLKLFLEPKFDEPAFDEPRFDEPILLRCELLGGVNERLPAL